MTSSRAKGQSRAVVPSVILAAGASRRLGTPKQLVARDGETLLVTGLLSTVLQLCCGRCGDWIEWPISIPEFILLLEPPFTDTIDLTPFLREDILLNLPVAASCRLDTENRCPLSGQIYLPASEPPPITGQDAWKELDKLKDREKE